MGIGGPPADLPLADVSVIGFVPASIFEAIFGVPNVLGVAFSVVFVDDNGDPIKTTRGTEDKAFTNGVTTLVYQPVNTMNTFYIGQPPDFLGPNDKGSYCEAWGSWPWN